jgi:LPXTG-site transpeptidase (sortase) family protein
LSPKVVRTAEIAEKAAKPNWQVPDQRFSLYIPKISAISRVIPKVNPFDRTEYLPALKKGVAHARGLAVPGETGTTYLFSHSVASRADYARYNAVFYLLHKLEPGDGVEIVYGGNWYKYQVMETKILGAKDVSLLKPQTDREILVLQTCYPPGTTWKRLWVIAERV